MIWLVLSAIALLGFVVGFVVGVAYGVHREQEAQVERLLRVYKWSKTYG